MRERVISGFVKNRTTKSQSNNNYSDILSKHGLLHRAALRHAAEQFARIARTSARTDEMITPRLISVRRYDALAQWTILLTRTRRLTRTILSY